MPAGGGGGGCEMFVWYLRRCSMVLSVIQPFLDILFVSSYLLWPSFFAFLWCDVPFCSRSPLRCAFVREQV